MQEEVITQRQVLKKSAGMHYGRGRYIRQEKIKEGPSHSVNSMRSPGWAGTTRFTGVGLMAASAAFTESHTGEESGEQEPHLYLANI